MTKESQERRAFLKKAGTAAVTAPAAALLLSATARQASAGVGAAPISGAPPIIDDTSNEL